MKKIYVASEDKRKKISVVHNGKATYIWCLESEKNVQNITANVIYSEINNNIYCSEINNKKYLLFRG